MLLAWLQRLHRWVVGGEAWAAAYTWLSEHLPKMLGWLKERWASVMYFISTLGLGTWFASGIDAVNALGWGAWPFVGLIFALGLAFLFHLLLLMTERIMRLREVRSMPATSSIDNRTRSITPSPSHADATNAYVANRLRFLCNTSLDPAVRRLRQLISSRFGELNHLHPDLNRFIAASEQSVQALLKQSAAQLHNRLASDRLGAAAESELASLLRNYVDSYSAAARLLLSTYPVVPRDLIQTLAYKEWRAKHLEVEETIRGYARDENMQDVAKKFECLNLPDLMVD